MGLISKKFFILLLVASSLKPGDAGFYRAPPTGRFFHLISKVGPELLKELSLFGHQASKDIPTTIVNKVGKFGTDVTFVINTNVYSGGVYKGTGLASPALLSAESLTVPVLTAYVISAVAIGITAYKVYTLYRIHVGLKDLEKDLSGVVEQETGLKRDIQFLKITLATVTRNLARLQVSPSIPELNVLEEEINEAEKRATEAINKAETLKQRLQAAIDEAKGYAESAQKTSNYFLSGAAGSALAGIVFNVFPTVTIPVAFASGFASYLSRNEYLKAKALVQDLQIHLNWVNGLANELDFLASQWASIKIEIKLAKARAPWYEKLADNIFIKILISLWMLGFTVRIMEYLWHVLYDVKRKHLMMAVSILLVIAAVKFDAN